MLIHRQEYTSYHSFHSSPVGLTDWVCRNNLPSFEIQVATAYLNYGFLLQLESDRPVGLQPSRFDTDYRESKSRDAGAPCVHSTVGALEIDATQNVELKLRRSLLESIRGIRIYQEGGAAEYAEFFGDFAPKVKRRLEPAPVGGWVFEYRYSDGLQYRATLRCASADWQEDSLRIGPGTHKLVLELEAQGTWPDEDYASFAERGLDLLSSHKARQLEALSAQEQQEALVQLESLAALARKGKLLAGAPRFLTYFGRDSLISIAMLSGVVRSELTLLGIRSVLTRLSPDGEVAHEETVGEFAARSRDWHAGRAFDAGVEAAAVGGPAQGAGAVAVTGELPPPQLDYHMVDDDFLLPAVLERWAQTEDPQLLGRMLSEELQPGTTGFELVARNLAYCYRRFSQGLVSYHPESTVGDWRDSLGSQGVVYSYELNLGLAPAFPALVSSLRSRFPNLDEYLAAEHKADLSGLLDVFIRQTTSFRVQVPGPDIERRIRDWLIEADFHPEERRVLEARLSASIEAEADRLISWEYQFLSMALDQNKQSIGIQHNDLAFSLLFTDPPISDLDLMLRPLETDFPLGLRTGVGILVSNPAFCDRPEIRRELTRNHYHGLVVWPLIHNLLFHGLERQFSRLQAESADAYALQLRMLALQDYLRGLGPLLRGFAASELWTFTPRADGDLPKAFGLASGSSTESNPLQLWSSLGFTTVLG